MPRLRHFEFLVLKDKSASDSAQVPAASASVTVYKQGAIANGGGSVAEGGSGTVTVHDPGAIRSGDIVFVGTATGVTALVGTVTATTVPISGVAGGTFSWSDGSRIVPNTGAPTLFSDSAGVDSVANPLTTSARGIAEAWADAESVWHIQSGSGVTTALFVDFGGDGGTRLRSDELDGASAVAYVMDSRDALANASAKQLSLRRAGVEQAYFDFRWRLFNSNNIIVANVLNPVYGAAGDGITDDRAAIQAAIDDVKGGGKGGIVYLPPGKIYTIGSQLNLNDNGVTLFGGGRNATEIRALAGFPASTALIQMGKALGVFGTTIREVTINCNNVTGSIGVLMDGAQEGSGLERMQVVNAMGVGVRVTSSDSQQCALNEVDIAVNSAGAVGLDIASIGGTLRYTKGSIVATAGQAVDAIKIGGGFVHISDIHIENFVDGVDAASGATLLNVNGHSTVTNLVRIGASGGVDCYRLTANSSTNIIVDESVTPNLTITSAQVGSFLIYNRGGDGTRGLIVHPSNASTHPRNRFPNPTGVELARLVADRGTALATADFSISAGWGSTATVSGADGTDSRGGVEVTANGAGIAANPTITLTFKDGAWPVAPHSIATRQDTNSPAAATISTTARTTTTVIWTFIGTPVAATVYTVRFVNMG